MHNRTNTWGSGLALIHNSEYKVDTSNREGTDMYESCTWKITIGISTLLILGVYHPPDANNSKFIDNFMDTIMVELSHNESMVITGDLNIHWDDPDSNETLLIKNMI